MICDWLVCDVGKILAVFRGWTVNLPNHSMCGHRCLTFDKSRCLDYQDWYRLDQGRHVHSGQRNRNLLTRDLD